MGDECLLRVNVTVSAKPLTLTQRALSVTQRALTVTQEAHLVSRVVTMLDERATENATWNETQRPQSRGVRAALGTGYNRVKRIGRRNET